MSGDPSTKWSIRQTTRADRDLVDSLIGGARWSHLHLDWLEPATLTDRPPFLLATENGLPIGCLGCPPDFQGIAWLRAFAVTSGHEIESAWSALWDEAIARLVDLQVESVATLVFEKWFEERLRMADFINTNSVVFYEHRLEGELQSASDNLRPIRSSDLNAILALDHLAFTSLWRLSAESLAVALIQASAANLLIRGEELIGYQITTSSPFGSHLARLAVHPSWQRQGFGAQLVRDSIRESRELGVSQLSVNTQRDNLPSRQLYEKLGFRQTRQEFQLYEYALGR